jgi:uncharacterized protein YodC (DUF2158 family)
MLCETRIWIAELHLGGPILIMTPGEVNADGSVLCKFMPSYCIDSVHLGYADSYLSTKAISGQIGKPRFFPFPFSFSYLQS